MATMAGPQPVLQPLRQPDGARVRGRHRRARGGRERPGLRVGHGRGLARSVLGLCSTGDHIVAQRQLYAGTQLLLQTACPASASTSRSSTAPSPARSRGGPAGQDDAGVRRDAGQPAPRAGRPRRARRHRRARSPWSTRPSPRRSCSGPLDHGVDLVVHSATKAIAGHNDATLGVVAGSDELVDWLWGFAVLQGANASPVRRHERPARPAHARGAAARSRPRPPSSWPSCLEGHPRRRRRCATRASTRIPQHDLAKRQMAMTGGLLTFDLAGGLEAGGRSSRRPGWPSWPPRSAAPRRW